MLCTMVAVCLAIKHAKVCSVVQLSQPRKLNSPKLFQRTFVTTISTLAGVPRPLVSRFPVYLDTGAHSPDAEMSRLLALHKTCERLPTSSQRGYRSMLGVTTEAWCC
jgi:hypothetical protein